MSFENDYKAFMKTIFLKKYEEAEAILSMSDTKTKFIVKAINDFGDIRVKLVIEKFKSVGLKRSLEKVFDEHKSLDFESEYLNKQKNEKIVLIHQKNKLKNKLQHLSGNSFDNGKMSKNERDYLIKQDDIKKVSA